MLDPLSAERECPREVKAWAVKDPPTSCLRNGGRPSTRIAGGEGCFSTRRLAAGLTGLPGIQERRLPLFMGAELTAAA